MVLNLYRQYYVNVIIVHIKSMMPYKNKIQLDCTDQFILAYRKNLYHLYIALVNIKMLHL
jgi:hypothetical protein